MIRFSLSWQLVQSVVTIVADDDRRVPSLRNLAKHVADPRVREFLRRRYSDRSTDRKMVTSEMRDYWKEVDRKEAERLQAQFDLLYDDALREIDALLISTEVDGMKAIRDVPLHENLGEDYRDNRGGVDRTYLDKSGEG